MRKIWPLLFLVLLAACKRDPEVVIPGNQAPPDGTITDIVLESYVNRSYITLVGHQPDGAAMAASLGTLRTHNVSQADREAFLGQVMAASEYSQRTYDLGRAAVLNAVDTSDIRDDLDFLAFILSDTAYMAFWQEAQIQQSELQALVTIPAELQSGTINVAEMHRRLVTNKIYDEINMGTQNFVISMFQNFLARYPTEAERIAGETMVDGFPSQIFLVNGRTKTNFISIFLGSNDYYEGQVRDLFRRYLYREPTTEELATLTIAFKANQDYKALQKAVMSTDEYIGL